MLITSAPPLLDYEAAQTFLGGVSRATIKKLVASQAIVRVAIGRRTFFTRESLCRYVETLSDAA